MQIINYSDLDIPGIRPRLIKFPDGEFKIILDSIPEDEMYIIIVKTDQNPAQKILITAQISEILTQFNPKRIAIIHPWLSFSRQDKRFFSSEPLSIKVLLNLYLSMGVTDLISLDIHSIQFREPGVHIYESNGRILKIHNINFVSDFYKKGMRILSPTGEDEPFLTPLLNKNIPITYFKKEKYCSNCDKPAQLCKCEGDAKIHVKVVSDENFTGETILVLDDIIAGGGTMLSTIKLLKQAGASHINVGATHGFFNDLNTADEIINASDSIFISNSVKVPESLIPNLNIVDINSKLKTYIESEEFQTRHV